MKHRRRKTLEDPWDTFCWWMLGGIAMTIVFIVAGNYFIKYVVTT